VIGEEALAKVFFEEGVNFDKRGEDKARSIRDKREDFLSNFAGYG